MRELYLYLDCCVDCLAGWCAEQHMALLPPALHHALLVQQAGPRRRTCLVELRHWLTVEVN